jgi:signal peptidase II
MSAASRPQDLHRQAFRSAPAVAIFLAVAGAALAADLVSKHLVFEDLLADPVCRSRMEQLRLRPDPSPRDLLSAFRRDVAPGVRWTLSANPGVVFGLDVSRAVVKVVTILAIALVIGTFAASGARARATHLALAFILAGAAGNLYDRFFSVIQLPGEPGWTIRHHVRDFIDLGQLHYPWVFNLADAWLVIGVGLLMIEWVLHARTQRPAARTTDGT